MTLARRSEGEIELSEAPQVDIAIARDEDLARLDRIIEQVDMGDRFVIDEAEGRGVGIRGTVQDLWVAVWASHRRRKSGRARSRCFRTQPSS